MFPYSLNSHHTKNDKFGIYPRKSYFYEKLPFLAMKIKTTLLVLFLLPVLTLSAQKGLKGKWEGTITWGGYDKKAGDKFELYIEAKGHRVTGRTYIHQKNGDVITREFKGRIYEDRSMYLEEIPDPTADKDTEFQTPSKLRRYQFLYTRSIFESTLEGHWQEMIKDPLNKKRAIGRIYMTKADQSKA
ncbi:MAG: hypothetical protein DWQ02_23030 [Bacteroidetes bacterium]|nr:MAG: hypothetical protein DWQ02_23030 [Bacteroidota bacterium]